jgi:hypothetical protein
MREYAAGLAAERATEAERTAALTRLLDYLRATAAAVETIMPSRRRRTAVCSTSAAATTT